MGGCIAGLAQSPLVCAVDLVKTQRQVQSGWKGQPPLQIARPPVRNACKSTFFDGVRMVFGLFWTGSAPEKP